MLLVADEELLFLRIVATFNDFAPKVFYYLSNAVLGISEGESDMR